MKLLMTGGHAGSTAYAFVKYLKTQTNWELFFVGSVSAVEGRRVKTLEELVLPTEGVKFIPLTTGRLRHQISWLSLMALLKIPLGLLQSLWLVAKIKPDAILSFGGFAGFPVVLAGFIFRIPVVLHEQTAVIGRANLWSLPFAKSLALSRQSSLDYVPKFFSRKRISVTGNPINLSLLKKVSLKKRERLTLFIHGGSRGSAFINNLVMDIAPELLSHFFIVHQTGSEDYLKVKTFYEQLPSQYQSRFKVVPYFLGQDWVDNLLTCNLVVSRAGANICSELMVAKKPALLIPLPFNYLDEQYMNAMELKKANVAEVVKQVDIKSDLVLSTLTKMSRNLISYQKAFASYRNQDVEASKLLFGLVTKLTSK
jgi:UDP-N-acetylglucosamine--N-acetylmuramyl-(pentapeptide) pyrophosphoryl-undecaprenol N-acetylglucosamine transferase